MYVCVWGGVGVHVHTMIKASSVQAAVIFGWRYFLYEVAYICCPL